MGKTIPVLLSLLVVSWSQPQGYRYSTPSSVFRPSRPSPVYGPQNTGFTPGPTFSGSTFTPAPTYTAPSSNYGPPGYRPSSQNSYRPGGSFGGGDFDNFEPANYQFQYDVDAPEYGTKFGHQESRQGDFTQGRYYVLLPDGRTQVVDYTADESGYHPRISYS